jgi:prolyl-tRNA editing enzyme YbaK/EbsC (Cys-tRNA(Pro) deacylase)
MKLSRFCLFKKTPPFINVLYNKTGAEIKTVCELLSDYLLTEVFPGGITDLYKAFREGFLMAIEKVREFFRTFGMEDKILEFEVSSATVELAAAALGCEGKRIAKTLSFMVGEKPVLIVAAGDARIANPKYKAEFGTKAAMLSFEEAEKLIGHAVGGVCPFAVNEGVSVYLDESLKRFETVFPACGSSNSAIELSIPELEKYSGFEEWIDVCKDWE